MDAGISRRRLARRAAGGIAAGGIAAVALVGAAGAGRAADTPHQQGRVEIVRFADAPVRVVRGAVPGGRLSLPRETLRFGNSAARPVAILRGPDGPGVAVPRTTVERIAFAGPVPASVTIVRGPAARESVSSPDMVLSSSAADFERIAEAVHGAESSHGADPAMWRPDPDGPQGPMQVSAAAARDSGGGNRFDLEENRLLGRAYLARMFRRYGNWPDALAAYNWGPGNLDRWIAGGRDAGRLPVETTRYIGRVLRDAGAAGSRIAGGGGIWPVTR